MSGRAWCDGVLPPDGKLSRRARACGHLWRPVGLGLALLLAVGACGPPRPPYPEALQSERPEDRVRAIKQAAEARDHSVTGILVDRLEDDDEVVRFYAILALEKLTGTRLGYDYHAPEALRWRAVQRWRRELAAGAFDGGGTHDGPDLAANGGTDP